MVMGRRTRASSRLVFLLLVLVVDHNSLDFIVVLGLGWSQMYLLCVLSKGYVHTGNDGTIDANKHGGDDDTVICVKIFVAAVLFESGRGVNVEFYMLDRRKEKKHSDHDGLPFVYDKVFIFLP